MSRELEEIAALLSSSAPQLLGEPIEERARSEDKTVWSVGGCVVRRANSAPVRDLFRREHRLLHHVRGRVSLGVPTPLFITATGEFDILEKAPGEPVAFEWWASLDAVSQEGIASHFGRFLAEFHELFPLETASAMGFERSFWPPSASWIETRLRGRLDSPERRSLLEDLLRVAPWLHEEALPPVLLHDDFCHHNAGFSEDGKQVLGAFDFTHARIGDPHRDLRYAFTCEPFAETMIREYERTRRLQLDRRRLRAWHAWSALAVLAWELHEGDSRRLPMRWGWVDQVAAWDRDFLDVE